MRTSRRVLLAPILVAGLASSLALTGCFGNPVENLVNKAANDDSGASSQNDSGTTDDSESDGAESNDDSPADIDVDTDDGEVNVKFKDLPKDFPASDVPLYNEQIITSSRIKDDDGTSWMVSLQVDDGESAFDAAAEALESAGFEEQSSMDLGGMATNQYAGNGYGVNLSALIDDDKDADDFDILSYSVTDGVED